MLISADTPADVLDEMAANAPGELSYYSLYIGKLFDWIDRLRWAYVRIWEDNDFALALFSDRQRALYEAFEGRLKQSAKAI